ncbi:hypothetical protein NMY22_g10235 [Coprinellus aureogranulatus]|nr:hypothetical protein NMY22_g10235 [Coprinellus aureogranulatus]
MTSRRHWASYALPALVLTQVPAYAQTWCGKNYMRNQTIVPPGGQFPTLSQSSSPLLVFRCSQTIRPYLPDDVNNSPSILVSSFVSNTRYPDSAAWTPPPGFPSGSELPAGGVFTSRNLTITVTVDGQDVASGSIPEIPTGGDPDPTRNQVVKSWYELPLDLSKLQPRNEHYSLECKATLPDGQEFRATNPLSYLPERPGDEIGSVTKMDGRSGALLVQSHGGSGAFKEIFPIGFYTQFDNYLTNITVLSELKDQGFNVIHPIPPFPSTSELDKVLDEMERLGLYLMYDMRWTYQNTSSVTDEVNHIKKRTNLLLWYTADEPDGTSDPRNATVVSYRLINSLDGGDETGGSGYHPVSLVLNCQDYLFTDYASGADIVMQDAYPIGNNVTFSEPWGTECTPDYGDCGCDNCKGSLRDISDRLVEYRDRLFANGWDKTKALWSVPQGFGNVTYWKRTPTGQEFMAQSVLAINYDSKGIISWTDPTTSSIKSAASTLAKALPSMTPYLLSPSLTLNRVLNNSEVGLDDRAQVSVAVWTTSEGSLVTAVNLSPNKVSVTLNLLAPFTLAPNEDQVRYTTVSQVLGVEGKGVNHTRTGQQVAGDDATYLAASRYDLDGLETGAWIYTG